MSYFNKKNRKSSILLFIVIIVFLSLYFYRNIKRIYEDAEKESSYNRKEWGKWIDEDGDGFNTRQEVLIEESLIEPIIKSNKVIYGKWYDVFSGEYFSDPKYLDIDHFVPLKNAYESGASNWSKRKKYKYYNYLKDKNHLIAVSKTINRSKGHKSPVEWLPPNKEYQCEYVRTWYKIKKEWGLTIEDGFDAVSNMVCRGK